VRNFAKRKGFKFATATTSKQQTIYSFLHQWQKWIVALRELIQTIGLQTEEGFIKHYNIFNADEFALEPSTYKYKHIVKQAATMVNVQELMCGYSNSKRYCTVTAIVPKSGFSAEADC